MQGWYGLGRIGRLEEVETKSGTRMAKFSLAIDEWDSREKDTKTTWINCICFSKTADFVLEHFEVGKPIFVESGKISVNEWTDENDNKRSRYDVIANRVNFVPGSKEGNGSSDSSKSKSDYAEKKEDDSDIWDIDEDDDPFADN